MSGTFLFGSTFGSTLSYGSQLGGGVQGAVLSNWLGSALLANSLGGGVQGAVLANSLGGSWGSLDYGSLYGQGDYWL